MAIQDKTMPNGYTHAGKQTLKERGWTDSLINKFLPAAEKLVVNHHFRSGPKKPLWSWETIFAAEIGIADKLAARMEKLQSEEHQFKVISKKMREQRQMQVAIRNADRYAR